MTERLSDHLSLIPIFSGLNAQELQTIEKYMFFNKVEPGEYVFKEGEKGDYVCFVAAGALDVIKLNQNAQPVVITTLAKGGSIGEMALIDKLTARPEVQAAWYVTGDTDLILYVVVPTMEAYEVFTREMLNDDARVRAFKTLISIREVLPFDPARRALVR